MVPVTMLQVHGGGRDITPLPLRVLHPPTGEEGDTGRAVAEFEGHGFPPVDEEGSGSVAVICEGHKEVRAGQASPGEESRSGVIEPSLGHKRMCPTLLPCLPSSSPALSSFLSIVLLLPFIFPPRSTCGRRHIQNVITTGLWKPDLLSSHTTYIGPLSIGRACTSVPCTLFRFPQVGTPPYDPMRPSQFCNHTQDLSSRSDPLSRRVKRCWIYTGPSGGTLDVLVGGDLQFLGHCASTLHILHTPST